MENKSEMELQYKKLEDQLSFYSKRKDNLEEGSKLIRKEISRIEDKIDEITKELLTLIAVLRK